MLRCSTTALLSCALSFPATGQAPAPQPAERTIGSPAPDLAAATWLRGESRAALPRDRVHVVEFWATWCGPCIAAFPHLGDLASKWADKVRIVGINSWDHRGKQRDAVETAEAHRDRITAFLAEQGERVRFDVASDDAQGTLARAWMTAAGRDTIPCTFVVDREGRIAWIGNPQDLDAPLAAIVEGRWDLGAHKAEFEAERQRARAAADLRAKVVAAAKAGDLAAFDALLAKAAPVATIYTAIDAAPEFGLAVVARRHGTIDEVAATAWCSMCAKIAELATEPAVKSRAVEVCAECAKSVPPTRAAVAACYQARCTGFAGDAATARKHLERARTLVANLEPASERQAVEHLIAMTERAIPAAK